MDYQVFLNGGIASVALFFAYLIFKTFIDQQKSFIELLMKQLEQHDTRMIDGLKDIAEQLTRLLDKISSR